MRHTLRPILTATFAAFLAGFLAASLTAPRAYAVPVYLRLDSRFPSGHHPRAALENRLKKVQFQRWLQVTVQATGRGSQKEKVYGWVPEEIVLTPLKLAAEGVLLESLPMRTEKQMDSIQPKLIAKGTQILILEVDGSWVRGVPVPDGELESQAKESWFPSESVSPVVKNARVGGPRARLFLPSSTAVYVLPGMRARIQTHIRTSTIVSVEADIDGFFEVRQGTLRGFVRKADAVTLKTLGEKSVRAMTSLTPLRSAPLPYADLVRTLPAGAKLDVIGSQTLRWGLSKVPEAGDLWWPISDEKDDEKPTIPLDRLATEELFKRKIFDMASSPAIPSLKFVSASGVYRTVDGKEWQKLASFEDKNYPIAIAAQGSVFIGPLVSDDHGETFEQWIRWDSLVSAIRQDFRITPSGLQILEIKPQDPEGQRVLLKLNVGSGQTLSLLTDDQGVSWRRFSSVVSSVK